MSAISPVANSTTAASLVTAYSSVTGQTSGTSAPGSSSPESTSSSTSPSATSSPSATTATSAPSGGASSGDSSSSAGSASSSSSSSSTGTSVTVALSDGTLETTTTNADGSQTITYSDPSSPPQGTSGSVLNEALAREAAHKKLEQGGFAFVNSLAFTGKTPANPSPSVTTV